MDNGLVHTKLHSNKQTIKVLILIVVDNGLVHSSECYFIEYFSVLILIVVDNGLVPTLQDIIDYQ